MMKINIVAVGKIKENYFKSAADEYIKRLSRYCLVSVKEIPAASLPENPTAAQVEAALKAEAVQIKKQCEKSEIIALCVEGEALSSENFARVLENSKTAGASLSFVIGGSYGLHESIKKEAKKRISFSEMTFPHRLFRVMLLEQIYRAFKINEGGTYHK